MQPAMKISLVLRAEALSPGSTRQNSVLFILSMTCTWWRTWVRDSNLDAHVVKQPQAEQPLYRAREICCGAVSWEHQANKIFSTVSMTCPDITLHNRGLEYAPM